MLEYLRRQTATPTTLLEIIAAVRSRWRLKLALRGALGIAVIGFALFLLTAYALQWARFSDASIIAARLVMLLGAASLVVWFLVRPLRRRVSDEQVAMYLEEHEPSLQAMLLSAVETSREGHVPESTALVRRIIEQAIETCTRIDAAHRMERIPVRRYAAATGVTALVALLALLVGPAFLRHAISALVLIPSVQAASPYKISLTPGNVTVPKGADQKVSAMLSGFNSEDAQVMVRRTPGGPFEPLPLARNNETGKYEGMIFDVLAPLDYYVTADGVVSGEFHMKVVEVPYVQRLELEYHFPAYTGLEPQKVEDGGDVAVLRGSEVRVHIFPTMKTGAGRISLNDKQSIPLKVEADGTFTAAFTADQDGFYRVEFDAPNGEHVIGSPQFTIDVLADQPPVVTFNKPGRDTSVSPIEEVFTEANVVDDYGVKDLELVYSVNGGPEKVLKLFNGTKRLPEVQAGHTFYLEELNVKAGDAVSYYARATDNDAVSGAKQASSDLYFLRIRPFKKDFRQAQSQGGGGGGGGGGGAGQVEALSEQQRQIISATFNVQRDRKKLTSDKLRENSTVVSLSQSRLREQVEGLLTRINSQLIERDPAFAKIGELLPQAVTAMKEAETKLSAAAPDQALPPENKALQILQTAEEEYETQVQVSRQQGGGGGGGGQVQQELAALFEQELNKMASRYETASQASEQNRDREVDELLEKLKELARRQEQEAERQRRRAIEGQQGGGSSGAQQRALADQVEEAARRLERLSREEQRPELQEAARQMREAADAMRRAAAGGDANASAQAQAALERLRETEKKLQKSLTQRAQRDIEDAKRQADAIAREQQEILDQVKQLPASPQARAQQANRINEKKDALEAKLGELEGNLDRAAREASREEKQASRKMSEAASAIRDNRLRDAVKYSKPLVSRGNNQQATAAESDIARGIDEVRQRLDEAQAALGQGKPGDKKQEAAERAQRLARGAESLQERTRERAQANRGDQGKQGQQGKEGQQGQGGQQGKDGQQGQGQQGQQGQGGQGGQRGQQGQQGQGGQRGDGQNGGARNGLGDRADAGGFGGADRGAWRGDATWGGWWEGGRLTADDIRQLRGEARQYANDAEQLRGLLRGEKIDPKELDEIIKNLQQLQDERVYQNVQELARLQAYVAENLKRFEFGLRRQVKGDAGASALTGSDEVPEEFKALVEQYYKSLAKTPR